VKNIKLKICGLRDNIREVLALQPDYVGFIFYGNSPRCISESTEIISTASKKVGVFVNEPPEKIIAKVTQYGLDAIQLHGDESVKEVLQLRALLERDANFSHVEIWKVFGVSETFDFERLKIYEPQVDRFLFDTKSTQRGGTGKTFNWKILKNYPFKTPFILSGGIGLEELPEIEELLKEDIPIYAIDVNSRFEISPGLKDIDKLEKLTNYMGRDPHTTI